MWLSEWLEVGSWTKLWWQFDKDLAGAWKLLEESFAASKQVFGNGFLFLFRQETPGSVHQLVSEMMDTIMWRGWCDVGLKHLASKSDKSMRPKLRTASTRPHEMWHLFCNSRRDRYLFPPSQICYCLIVTLNISKPLLVTTIGKRCSSKRSSSSSLLLKVVIIVILGMVQTCYAGRPRWALDHAVATVALEHDLTAILDFPEIFHRIIFSHL